MIKTETSIYKKITSLMLLVAFAFYGLVPVAFAEEVITPPPAEEETGEPEAPVLDDVADDASGDASDDESAGDEEAFAALAAEDTHQVHIAKYIDGEPATQASGQDNDFTMLAIWNSDNIGAGMGNYDLTPEDDYTTETVELSEGADYSTSEVTTGDVVGETCEAGKPFELAGYTTGSSYEEAANGTPSDTVPAFTDLSQDQYVIVWNETCEDEPEFVTVTIYKYLDEEAATALSATGTSFAMNATWDADNIGAGSGSFSLSPVGFNNPNPYRATTAEMSSGADYSLEEVTTGDTVGATCAAGKPYALSGYSVGDSLEEAEDADTSTTSPALTNLTEDAHIIVWNEYCLDSTNGTSTGGGTIGGEVVGGVDQNGTLQVTSVTAIDDTATADGTFENGWKYVFHITVPTDEENLAMKFSNWMHESSSSTIPVANNMRISSEQAASETPIVLTAENVYSSPDLVLTEDLDSGTIGRQVEVLVEVAVPSSTVNGSYSTNYGVRSLE